MMWKSNNDGLWFYMIGGFAPTIISIIPSVFAFVPFSFYEFIPPNSVNLLMALTTIIFIILYKMKPSKK